MYSRATDHGTGIIVFGDNLDLTSLCETIRSLYDGVPLVGTLEECLYDLAHEVAQASQGSRVIMPPGHAVPEAESYSWIIRLWPRFLMELGMLRWASGFHPISKRDQANLFSLEACAERALLSYDGTVGQEAIHWLNSFTGLPDTYLTEFIVEVDAMYVRSSNTGKERFRRLPEFLRMLHPWSKDYLAFQEQMIRLAKEKNCEPDRLIADNFPEFEW